jgi:uncharacterized protein YdeI (YjbR/CyaY-like superfamily)
MAKRDARIDAYIAKSADFAKPILEYFRGIVHTACPDVEETMKWSMPYFDYHGIFCGMAAFKEHCAITFWKASLLFPDAPKEREAMGHFGRVTSIRDLPPKKELISIVKRAAKLNEAGVKAPARAKKPKSEVDTPDILLSALNRNKAARETFTNFSPSHRREYVEWITEAQTDATRAKRVEQTIAWLAEGKRRNWKYER